MCFLNRMFVAKAGASSSSSGFTLLELLIAMFLTSVICFVLFSTYISVVESGNLIKNTVSQRETKRIFYAVLNDDMSCLYVSKGSIFSKSSFVQSKKWLSMGEDAEIAPSTDEIIISFCTTNSLYNIYNDRQIINSPVFVEYVLRHGRLGSSIVRRERGYCGIDGVFPWEEMVCLRDIDKVRTALLMQDADFEEEWVAPVQQYPSAVRFSFEHQGDGGLETVIMPVPVRKIDVRN